MLYRYLTGKRLSSKKAVEYLEAEGDGESLAQEGCTLETAMKALRKLRVRFKYRSVGKLRTTRRLVGRMAITCDGETYTEPHAVLLHRDGGTVWLFDCLNPSGAVQVSEEEAVRLVNRSDETFLVERIK